MTGGSGNSTAVPLPRDPTTIDVVLVPVENALVLENAVDRLLRSRLA